jgi:agmatine deiminase
VTTPRAQGFAMPPEWAPHARCWMAWPCRPEPWGERLAAARRTVAEIAKAIAQYEPVTMIARPELTAEASLQCGKGISVLPLEYDACWTRDTVPTFVCGADGTLAGIDWGFDGYGERAAEFAADAGLAAILFERLQITRFAAPLVLEGGAIQVDGEGTCLVCAPAVLDARRNREVSRQRVEEVLGEFLAIDKVIWLEHGFIDDPAGGHVDNVACFVRPGTVLALASRDEDDGNHEGLAANLERLRAERDARGRELEVIEVRQPGARFKADGRRVTASYLNLYLANGAVILPMFDDPMDDAAFRAVAAAWPEREVVQVEVGDLVHGGSGIHGVTREQPACAPPEAAA